nr:hypothetical protein [Pseudomonas aeruginosa]
MGLNNAFGDMLLMFVMGTMFIVLPTFWIMALAWRVFAPGMLQGLAGATGTPRLPEARAEALRSMPSQK